MESLSKEVANLCETMQKYRAVMLKIHLLWVGTELRKIRNYRKRMKFIVKHWDKCATKERSERQSSHFPLNLRREKGLPQLVARSSFESSTLPLCFASDNKLLEE